MRSRTDPSCSVSFRRVSCEAGLVKPPEIAVAPASYFCDLSEHDISELGNTSLPALSVINVIDGVVHEE